MRKHNNRTQLREWGEPRGRAGVKGWQRTPGSPVMIALASFLTSPSLRRGSEVEQRMGTGGAVGCWPRPRSRPRALTRNRERATDEHGWQR